VAEADVFGETHFTSLEQYAEEPSTRAVWSVRSVLLVGLLF
jgi:hypothetical protein